MANQVIIYKQDNGILAIVIPAPECLREYTIEKIANKDVPPGKPYKIVDTTQLPSDTTFVDAWEIDESELTDGIGNYSNTFE